ncbi:hypothetical protein RI129_000122 [Pyrocoelia pectoralis]|uniref:Uncharacterized protein n=1 Tax=Pyrocoelia pectoralis TaxID=417401 RepID=A0AAN7USC5_9COLE
MIARPPNDERLSVSLSTMTRRVDGGRKRNPRRIAIGAPSRYGRRCEARTTQRRDRCAPVPSAPAYLEETREEARARRGGRVVVSPPPPALLCTSPRDAPKRRSRRAPTRSGGTTAVFKDRAGGTRFAKWRAANPAASLEDDPQPDVVQERRSVSRTAMCVRIVDVRVSCSSHYDAHLAAFFIDPRAE